MARRRPTRKLRRRLGPPRWLPLLLAVLLGAAWREGGVVPLVVDGQWVRVVDGDSLAIGGERLRLRDIDAPEASQFCSTEGGLPWPCGQVAHSHLASLIRGVRLQCSRHGRDRYGRLLASCSTAEEPDIGAAMVRDGHARALTRPRTGRYAREEAEARSARRGIWQGDHQDPAEWRQANR